MAVVHEGLYEDILVHRCESCASMWLSPTSLDRLDDNVMVDASTIDWRPTGEESGIRCPKCVGTYRHASPLLETVSLADAPQIVVHRCGACRSFLLGPEMLDRIRGHVAGMGVAGSGDEAEGDPAITLLTTSMT